MYLSLECLFKVINVSDLTWLSDTLSVLEAFNSVVCNGFLSCLTEATKQEVTTDQSPCSSLASIAVNDDYILCALVEIYKHVKADLHEHLKSWTMMVLPTACQHAIIEGSRIVISA